MGRYTCSKPSGEMASIKPSCETWMAPRPLRRAQVLFPDPGGPTSTTRQAIPIGGLLFIRGHLLRRQSQRRLTLHHARQNGVKLPHSFRQRGRSWLKEICRLDLADASFAHSVDRGPASPRTTRLPDYFPSAPPCHADFCIRGPP